ncbi:response regulator transcription factor [Lacrimispora sp.]|uniref:response regulator transcription factor n=1 Tax=Lacrimispora sp. TaxID=2719234 RepID=UPI0028AFF1E1|nr:response regulator transcription factor [Lacrimispora sp.]
MITILICDDNRQLVSVLAEYCAKEGYTVHRAHDGQQALDLYEREDIDLVLLDIMMPVKDGFEVCRQIRSSSTIPIIMITARGEDFEKIMGLDIGADDYIVKPFSPGEVMARIRAIMRRIDQASGNLQQKQLFMYDNLKISLDNLTVTVNECPVNLTKKEIELLWLMATHRNRVYTRNNLLDLVWGVDYFGDPRTIDTHIKRLRYKLSDLSHPNWQIKTVWGSGYKFEIRQER